MGKKLSENIIQQIITSYQQGTTPLDIGIKFGIYNNSVTRILRKRNVSRTQASPQIKSNDVKVNYIIEQYSQGISSEKIAKGLNIAGTTVCKILKENNIVIRPSSENKKIFYPKDDFFSNIDSEDKAYFLGLLFADGNVSKKGYDIKLGLKDNDRDILEKFSQSIFGYVKITTDEYGNKGNYFSVVYIYSKQIKKDLIKYGCGPNKTFKIRFPNWMDNHLKRHFIRGYLDGDGCIYLGKDKTVINFTSNKWFLIGLQKYIKSELNIDFYIHLYKKNLKIGDLRVSALENGKIFLDWLYKDSNLYLNRKYQKYINAMNRFKK